MLIFLIDDSNLIEEQHLNELYHCKLKTFSKNVSDFYFSIYFFMFSIVQENKV